MDINLSDLQYFIEATQTKNFSRAAERIGITQPTLSQSVQRLEASVGTQLFIRSKKGVELTAAGQQLTAEIKKIIESWNQLKKEALKTKHEVSGVIRLGCHASVALYSLPNFLPKILKTYPSLEVVLEHDLSRKIVDSVIHYRLDVGLVINPTRHPDLVITHLVTDKVTLWTNGKDSDVIYCDDQLLQSQHILRELRKKSEKHRLIRTSSLELACALAAHGGGHAILPTRVALMHGGDRLQPVKGAPSFKDDLALVYRQENKSLKSLEVFVKEMKRSFESSET